MPRLDQLSELQRKTLLTHPCLLNDTAPWTPLQRPLSEARLALVTTAGLHVRGDHPFTGGDQTFRTIPAAASAGEIIQSHASIGFDRSGLQQDLNTVFPVDRMRELTEQREIGSLGPRFFSFMGAQRAYDRLLNDTGPAVAQLLHEDGVDVVFLTGT
jgi:D-proline reductase (dithiol) PrdB